MFEWDQGKALANLLKHGVAFDEARSVFLDPNALDGSDESHSQQELRAWRLGRSAEGRVLLIVYTKRRRGDEEAIRLISARRASRRERSA